VGLVRRKGVRILIVMVSVLLLGVACGPLLSPPWTGSAAQRQLVAGDNAFAIRLFRQLVKKQPDSNIFISPVSAAITLGMLYNGAEGTTRQAMAKVLGLQGMRLSQVDQAEAALRAALANAGPQVRLLLADSLWVNKGMGVGVVPAFKRRNEKYFGAKMASLDFRQPGAPGVINAWASRHTQGKVKSVIKHIPHVELLLLLNAIYFDGKWEWPFNPSHTTKHVFTLENGQKVQVPMMFQSHKAFPLLRSAKVEAVSLPYGNGRFSMYVFVPRRGEGLPAFEEGLTSADWNRWVPRFRKEGSVILGLPRFELRYQQKLKGPLRRLGLGLMFGGADFRGVCAKLLVGCHVNIFQQTAYLQVNEKGTVAAAVTVAGIEPSTLPPRVIIDRPFLLVIRDEETGAIVFMGSIVNPLQ
jgi:serpin B